MRQGAELFWGLSMGASAPGARVFVYLSTERRYLRAGRRFIFTTRPVLPCLCLGFINDFDCTCIEAMLPPRYCTRDYECGVKWGTGWMIRTHPNRSNVVSVASVVSHPAPTCQNVIKVSLVQRPCPNPSKRASGLPPIPYGIWCKYGSF